MSYWKAAFLGAKMLVLGSVTKMNYGDGLVEKIGRKNIGKHRSQVLFSWIFEGWFKMWKSEGTVGDE